MTPNPSFSVPSDPRSGGVIAFLLFVIAVVAAIVIYANWKEGGKPSPFQSIDEILADEGSTGASDTRAATVRMKLSEMKAERAKVDKASREAMASIRVREADISSIRGSIADARNRIAVLKAKYREDPSDESVKDNLYRVLVKLKGGEGVEGLETRLERATAALAAAKAVSDDLGRRLASLDSAIAIAESHGQTVVDYVRHGEAKTAVGKARRAGKDIDRLAESTEGAAIEVAAGDEAAKSRRDAALESLLEEL